MKRLYRIFSISLFIVLFSACVKNPVTGKGQFGVMSEEREIAMGKAYDPQIVAQFGLYVDEDLQAYINAKGKEMAAISHRPQLEYEFKIMDSPVVNAFAVPGGFVYFTRGIMAHFNNEAEFAGVLGHEIGHITARHSVVQQRNATFAQLGLIAGMIAAPELAQFAEPASAGVQLLLLKFGRDAESQSDELGVEYSTKIGYDSHEMAQFFNTLARKSEDSGAGEIPTFLSTHPNPLNRKENVHELTEEWQANVAESDFEVGRNSYLQMIDGLVYGEDPRQGFVENWVFYHPDLEFEFPVPNGWQYQNSPQQFQMAPADGKSLMFLALAQGTDLQQAAGQLIEQYQLQVISNENGTVNGFTAIEVIGQQVTQQATADTPAGTPTVKAKIMLIKYDGRIYQIVGASAPGDFNSYQSQFNTTMGGFKRLTDQSKLNRLPERIDIVSVSSTMTLEQALRSKGIPDSRLEEFAVLNGMELSDQMAAGRLFKVISQN
ncbi:MAG: M48 family metalloprotease [Flavobacteriales bacterium]|nr:M48 family metalloprotease [Flavobacteriales bacterium]